MTNNKYEDWAAELSVSAVSDLLKERDQLIILITELRAALVGLLSTVEAFPKIGLGGANLHTVKAARLALDRSNDIAP